MESTARLSDLNSAIAVTVADLGGMKKEEQAKLVLPILAVAARLGAIANGKKLTANEMADIQSKLMEVWSDPGVSVAIQNGRIVSTILVRIMRQWLADQAAHDAVQAAA